MVAEGENTTGNTTDSQSRSTNAVPPSYSYEGRRVPGPTPYGPPPPYNSIDGNYAVHVTSFHGPTILDASMTGPILCPHCHQYTIARVGYSYNKMAYVASCFLCLTGCCCLCFWLPFCMESFVETKYYCSYCGRYLGISHSGGTVF